MEKTQTAEVVAAAPDPPPRPNIPNAVRWRVRAPREFVVRQHGDAQADVVGVVAALEEPVQLDDRRHVRPLDVALLAQRCASDARWSAARERDVSAR
eukprot:2033998-Prymnesium_polylepis.2